MGYFSSFPFVYTNRQITYMQKDYHVTEGFVRRYPYDPRFPPLLSHVFARQCNTAGDGVNVFFFFFKISNTIIVPSSLSFFFLFFHSLYNSLHRTTKGLARSFLLSLFPYNSVLRWLKSVALLYIFIIPSLASSKPHLPTHTHGDKAI